MTAGSSTFRLRGMFRVPKSRPRAADRARGEAVRPHSLASLAYFSAALSNPLPQTSRFSINLDGKTIEREGLGILIVNFSKIQFDISVTHENQPRDGVLVVTKDHHLTALEDILAEA